MLLPGNRPPPTARASRAEFTTAPRWRIGPPTFVLFVNDPDLFKDNYRRFLEKHFRQNLDFTGTPIRFLWRGKSERLVGRAVRKLERSLTSR
jgi:GTP-binding protein